MLFFGQFVCPCWIAPRYAAVYSLGISGRWPLSGLGVIPSRARVCSVDGLVGAVMRCGVSLWLGSIAYMYVVSEWVCIVVTSYDVNRPPHA